MRFPGDSVIKNLHDSTGDTRDVSLIPRSGRSPGGGNGNPLQCSCLEKSMDRGARWALVHGVSKSWTQLSIAHTFDYKSSTFRLLAFKYQFGN